MKKFSTGKIFYLCCFLFIGFGSGHVSASSPAVNQLIKSFDSFEVDGLSLAKKESDIVGILNSKGYKLKKKNKNDSRYWRVENKRRYKAAVKTSLKNGGLEYLQYPFPADISPEFIESEKARITKVFDGFARACNTRKLNLRCTALTDTNVVSIAAIFYKKHVQYTLVNRPDYKARSITAQREHAIAHKKQARKEKEIKDAAATKAYRKEMVVRREREREASHQRMLEENRQLFEKRKKAAEAMGEREKNREEQLYKLYYANTPEREKSKYSDAERKIMKDGKLKVPSSYAAPTAEEIRLAVMRSIVNRANGGEGNDPDNPYVKVQQRQKKVTVAVVTDGDTVYLPVGVPASVGMQIKFKNVENARCSKRKGGQGYMCQYRLSTQADSDRYSKGRMATKNIFSGPSQTIARLSVQFMTRAENYNNWFILTENGWRQPHTKQNKSEIRDNERTTAQRVQQQNNMPRHDTSMIGGALQDLQGGFRAQGASAALELKRLW